jgi:hypothetical protein
MGKEKQTRGYNSGAAYAQRPHGPSSSEIQDKKKIITEQHG